MDTIWTVYNDLPTNMMGVVNYGEDPRRERKSMHVPCLTRVTEWWVVITWNARWQK